MGNSSSQPTVSWGSWSILFENELECLRKRADQCGFACVLTSKAMARPHDAVGFLPSLTKSDKFDLVGLPIGVERITVKELLANKVVCEATGMTYEQVVRKVRQVLNLKDQDKVYLNFYIIARLPKEQPWISAWRRRTGQIAYGVPSLNLVAEFYIAIGDAFRRLSAIISETGSSLELGGFGSDDAFRFEELGGSKLKARGGLGRNILHALSPGTGAAEGAGVDVKSGPSSPVGPTPLASSTDVDQEAVSPK